MEAMDGHRGPRLPHRPSNGTSVSIVQAGAARHDTMQHCLIWAAECARASLFPATTAVERLGAIWARALADEPRRAVLVSDRATEFEAMLRHAIGKAETKPASDIAKLHDDVAGVRMNVGPAPILNGQATIAATDELLGDIPPLLVWERAPDLFVIPPLTWQIEGLWAEGTHGELAGPKRR